MHKLQYGFYALCEHFVLYLVQIVPGILVCGILVLLGRAEYWHRLGSSFS